MLPLESSTGPRARAAQVPAARPQPHGAGRPPGSPQGAPGPDSALGWLTSVPRSPAGPPCTAVCALRPRALRPAQPSASGELSAGVVSAGTRRWLWHLLSRRPLSVDSAERDAVVHVPTAGVHDRCPQEDAVPQPKTRLRGADGWRARAWRMLGRGPSGGGVCVGVGMREGHRVWSGVTQWTEWELGGSVPGHQ